MLNKIHTLIIDDEPPARNRLRELLEKNAEVEIIGECRNGREALRALQDETADLVFLDIQMPVMDGLRVVQTLPPEKMPITIFVTAYDRYALKAFEVNALDYLLKPFSDERFATAFARAKIYLQSRQREDWNAQMRALLKNFSPGANAAPCQNFLDRLVIKSAGRVFFLKAEEIDWIEGAGVYAKLYAGGKTHLYRETVGGLAAQLDPQRFVRVHRSTLVNLERIKELLPYSHGEFIIVLKDETRLKLSRNFRGCLQARLGQSL